MVFDVVKDGITAELCVRITLDRSLSITRPYI